MAESKKSFIAYSDWHGTFKALPDDVAGQLIKHIFSYVNNENPKPHENYIVNALFEQIKATLKRDLIKWEKQRKQRSEAGKRSAQLRKEKSNERSTSVNERSTNIDETTRKPTVNVNVNDNVNVSVNDNINKKENTSPSKSKSHKPKKVYDEKIILCTKSCIDYFSEELKPKTQKQKWDWVDVIDKLNRIDGYSLDDIVRIVKGARNDDFWQSRFLTLPKLRNKNKDNVKYITVFNEMLKAPKKQQFNNKVMVEQPDYDNLKY